MSFQNREEEFFNRFGLDSPKFDDEELEKFFRTGIMNCLDEIDFNIDLSQIKRFCSWFGAPYLKRTPRERVYRNIYSLISRETSFNNFLFKIENVFALNFSLGKNNALINKYLKYKKELYCDIKEVFDNSKLPIGFERTGEQFIVFPRGCDFLDKELVIKTLKYLDENSHKHFSDALHHCVPTVLRQVEDVLKKSDLALYQAKSRGKNSYTVYQSE